MILKDTIFRAYDIRGKAFIDFDEDGFMALAQAFGQYIKEKHKLDIPKIFVSGDGRQSMPELSSAVISGLQGAGCDVVFGGTIPTPLNYFSLHLGNFDASIQISASHNPADENGLKLTDTNGAVCGEEIQIIKKLAQNLTTMKYDKSGECLAQCKPKSFLDEYNKKLSSMLNLKHKYKIVLDAGNSVSGMFYPEILRNFNIKVSELYCDLDTNFPNHQPDPERPENLKDLVKKVLEEKADFGLAFDGDGDRLGICLPSGEIITADKIIYLLAQDFLSRNPNEKIILDAMSSQTLVEKIEHLGGQVILSPTGHSHIEQNMHKYSSKLGGEQSGHFMFGEDFYGHDDACLAVLRFLQAVENNPNAIKEITEDWENLIELNEKFFAEDSEKFEILKKVSEKLLKIHPNASTIDGIRIDYGQNQWAIVRCSNTSPKISVRMEAKNEENLKKISSEIFEVLESEGVKTS